MAQAGVNVGAVAEGMQLANQGVYQAILPAGAKLVNSKDMEGAVRGFFRNKKGIAGQANWMNADSAVNKIAAANIANAAMGAAALVVGQYYMKQINDELADMNSNISKLANFQMAEYKGKVLTLMTQVKRASEFQTEILEDNNLRNEEIQRLQGLETTCMDLLNQATGLVTEHGIITSAYIDLMPKGDINSEYFHYLLHSFDVMKVFYNMGNGVRQRIY